MKKFAKNFLTALLVFALTASLVSAVSADSSDEAKRIIGKVVDKYSDVMKKDGKDMKSFEAEISIKGGGQVPMGEGGGMPLSVDANLKIFVAKPHNLYLELTGNLGNAIVVVGGKDKVTATIMLTGTKQYATMDVPDNAIKEFQQEESVTEEPGKMEDFYKAVTLSYEGTEKVAAGKAHKIVIDPQDSAEKASITVYILDGKWDPVKFVIKSDEANAVIEFIKMKMNPKINPLQFVAQIAGYTLISEKDLTTALMMMLMTAMMQQAQQ